MKVSAYKTHKITAGESLSNILDKYLPKLCTDDVVIIASKVVSLCEKNVVSTDKINSKFDLIKQESDVCFANHANSHGFYLTLKYQRLIPNAGIDESNAQNFHVLLPKNPQNSAQLIWEHLRKRDSINKLGVIISDSNVTPLRRGVIGIGIGWCGFEPIYNYIGKSDVFEQTLRVTTLNLLDSLATAATLVMGEGSEQTPLAIIKNAPKIRFVDRVPTVKEERELLIASKIDLFAPLFKKLKFCNILDSV